MAYLNFNEGRNRLATKPSLMGAPAGPAATPSNTGGTLTTATYYYKITGLNDSGETVGSTEVSGAIVGTTGSVALTWTALAGATSYRVYRGVVTNTQTVYYTVTTNSYTDTGAANTGGSVPAAGTAIKDGMPPTVYFELVDDAVSAMVVGDTLASRTQTASTATKSQAAPTPAAGVVTYTAMTWTETVGSPKAVRMMTSARGGLGKAICAWDINAGAAVNLATVAPLTVNLSFKLAYDGEV